MGQRANAGAKMAALVLGLAAACSAFGVGNGSAAAALPYQFDAKLSLTGDCTTSGIDPVPDPGCPYPPLPDRPTGRFSEPRSIAIDSYGNEYVASWNGKGQGRIDVFDDEGFFVTEFGNGGAPQSLAVDSQGNVYVAEEEEFEEHPVLRYSPTVYEPEAGNITYAAPPTIAVPADPVNLSSRGLAIDSSNDHLLMVSEQSKVLEYNAAAEGNGLVATIENPKIRSSAWPAVDADGRRLFLSYCKDAQFDCGVLVLEADAPYAVVAEIDGTETAVGDFLSAKGWLSVAVNEENGHLFVDDLEATKNVYEFDQDYKLVSTLNFSAFQGGNLLQIGVANTPANPAAANRGYLFVPALAPRNAAFAFKPPGVTPPEVSAATAAAVSEAEAELAATVDPNGGDTDYQIEYVTAAEFAVSEFDEAQIAAEGTVPGSSLPRRVSAHLPGLSAGTAYRLRVSAENEAGSDEEEAAFATYSDATAGGGCTNQSLRGGSAARLPDCRAYELVSPPDTQGHPVRGMGSAGDRFNTLQSSPLGTPVSFAVAGGVLPGFEGTGGINGDPYLATRGAGGWTTSAVGPGGAEVIAVRPGSPSPDQGFRFWAGVYNTGGDQVSSNFVRYPDGHSALVGRGSLETDERAKGALITEGGTHIVFGTRNLSGGNLAKPLEPDAPALGTEAVYDRTADEVTHVVSLLPGNVTPAAGQNARYLAASPDGEGIAFSIGSKVYLRLNNAITYEIGDGVELAGISEGGARAFYLDEGDLLAFDTGSETTVTFAESGDATAVNVAVDGSRAYLVSPSVLTGTANPNGATAQPGEQNLYLSEEGQIRFVATVTDRDVEGEVESGSLHAIDGLGLWAEAVLSGQFSRDPSRLTPDGRVMLFQSRANLTGFDAGGAPQVYRYDSVASRLHCVSCQPTGQAGAGASLQSFSEDPLGEIPLEPASFTPNITPDGGRAFFESTEALVSYDTDGRRDVYEWEEQGVGSCSRAGGCVYLISSPRSEHDDYLYGQSSSGDDVFFVSGDVLAGGDAGGTPSLYDARVGGGFPENVRVTCAGEGCRPGLTSPPPLVAPVSVPGPTSGNVTSSKTKQCPKNKRKVKRKGKVRCVPKKSKSAKGKNRAARAGKSRGARR